MPTVSLALSCSRACSTLFSVFSVQLAIGFDSFLNQGTGLLTSLPSITLTAWVAVLTLLYLSYTKPCNIPLCNWVSFACFVFPLWAYACSAVTFFVNHNGERSPLLSDVLSFLKSFISLQ